MKANKPVGLSVGGIELTSTPTSPIDWGLENISGWYESADISAASTQRPTSPGQFSQAGQAGGKSITVDGFVRSWDRALLMEAVEVISSTLADGSFDTLGVYDEYTGYRWASVQRVGTPQIDAFSIPSAVRFQLQFLAPDAYRYGQTSTASVGFSAASGSGMVFPLFNPAGFLSFGAPPESGVVTVQNPGSADASPVFTIAGPSPTGGFSIVDLSTGKRIRFLGLIPNGSTLTINAATGSVLLEGVADRLGDAIVEAWPVVRAQSTASFLFEPLGSATSAQLSASVVATYW